MLLLRWEKHVRETMGVSKQQTLVLLLDTGGGSLCHLSPEFTIACEAKRIRPVFFPPYSTSAVCAADQHPNRAAQVAWCSKRRTNSESLNQLEALHLVHEVWDLTSVRKTLWLVSATLASCRRIWTDTVFLVKEGICFLGERCQILLRLLSLTMLLVQRPQVLTSCDITTCLGPPYHLPLVVGFVLTSSHVDCKYLSASGFPAGMYQHPEAP